MERVRLGNTDIEVSRLGIGTGTAHPSGHCAQALMSTGELAGLLLFAFDRGINFWDTAVQYGTHPHVREALRGVRRSDVVISTKLTTSGTKDTLREFNSALKELGVDYIDVCLLHAVRTEHELKTRAGALYTLLELKEQGRIRAVGMSSHGLGALKAVTAVSGIDAVWVRINLAGLNMDAGSLGIYDRLAALPWVRRAAASLPRRVQAALRPDPASLLVSEDDRREVEETVRRIHAMSKGVVGMKVIAEGQLRMQARKAVEYVRDLPFVDSLVIGMLTEREIEENCRIVTGGD
ncbi:MAG: aldo/keto reductase [Nitrospirae bacterium]|nr:aldo/keto reductase [Nitrospirota bacterium]